MYNNKRLMLSIFWIVLGAALMVLSFMEKLDPSMYSAMGGVLIAIGALQMIRNLRYREQTGGRFCCLIGTGKEDERNVPSPARSDQ